MFLFSLFLPRFTSFPPLLTSYKVNETTSERALKDSAGERVVEPAPMPRHTHRVGGPAQCSGAAAGAPAAAAGSCLIIEPCSLRSGMFCASFVHTVWHRPLRPSLCTTQADHQELLRPPPEYASRIASGTPALPMQRHCAVPSAALAWHAQTGDCGAARDPQVPAIYRAAD